MGKSQKEKKKTREGIPKLYLFISLTDLWITQAQNRLEAEPAVQAQPIKVPTETKKQYLSEKK